MTTFHRAAEVAKALQINSSKVSALIRSGELDAVNVALHSGGKPRWRISEAALEAFLLRRSAGKPTPKATRARRKLDATEIQFL